MSQKTRYILCYQLECCLAVLMENLILRLTAQECSAEPALRETASNGMQKDWSNGLSSEDRFFQLLHISL